MNESITVKPGLYRHFKGEYYFCTEYRKKTQ